MEEQRYLIAIALAEQNNKRIMPIGGKTIKGHSSLNQLKRQETKSIYLIMNSIN